MWTDAQIHEARYWGDGNGRTAWHEFCKQEAYMEHMLIKQDYEVDGELCLNVGSVLDIGGGPVSMLLRCLGPSTLTVVDPMPLPDPARRRYVNYGIEYRQEKGEDFRLPQYDEVWMYNVLQHVDNPKQVLLNAINHTCGCFRIFEWLNVPTDVMHLHKITAPLILDTISDLVTLNYINMPVVENTQAFVGIFEPRT